MYRSPDPELMVTAWSTISHRVADTGQTVTRPTMDEAAEMLACIWQIGFERGVTVADWRLANPRLDQIVIDAVSIRATGTR